MADNRSKADVVAQMMWRSKHAESLMGVLINARVDPYDVCGILGLALSGMTRYWYDDDNTAYQNDLKIAIETSDAIRNVSRGLSRPVISLIVASILSNIAMTADEEATLVDIIGNETRDLKTDGGTMQIIPTPKKTKTDANT